MGTTPQLACSVRDALKRKDFELAPQVGLEPTTLRLTAECSTIELLRSKAGRLLPTYYSTPVLRCQISHSLILLAVSILPRIFVPPLASIMGCLVQLAANYASSFVGFHRGS